EIGMKTKRKLAPKSNNVSSSAGSGEHNVFRQCGYNNVCNVGPTVPSKRQCMRPSSSVPFHVPQSVLDPSVSSNTQCAGDLTFVPLNSQELEVFGLSHLHLSVPPKRRCTRQLKSASCRVEGLLTSDGNGQHSYRTNHVIDADSFLNQSSGHQERNICLRITRESTIGRDSLRRHLRASGSPPEYKHIRNCTHNCKHCGALFCSVLWRDIVKGLIDLLDTHNALF
nr:hypothetical protein [Tanacetum cinerariifolium]